MLTWNQARSGVYWDSRLALSQRGCFFWALLLYIWTRCSPAGLQCENRLRATPPHSGWVWLAAHVRAAHTHHPARQVEEDALKMFSLLKHVFQFHFWPCSRWCVQWRESGHKACCIPPEAGQRWDSRTAEEPGETFSTFAVAKKHDEAAER